MLSKRFIKSTTKDIPRDRNWKSFSDLLLFQWNMLIAGFRIKLRQHQLIQNPNARKIMDIVAKKEKIKIKDLQKMVGLKTYNNTFLNVKKLEEADFLVTKKAHQEKGRPVYVSLSLTTLGYYQIYYKRKRKS